MSDQPLFDMQPRHLRVGDKVVVQTIWGDERGVIRDVLPDTYYFTLIKVALERGDTITINSNRVVRT